MIDFLNWWVATWWRVIFALITLGAGYTLLDAVITYLYNTGCNLVNLRARKYATQKGETK